MDPVPLLCALWSKKKAESALAMGLPADFVPCSKCGRRVFASKSSRDLIAAGEVYPSCEACLADGVYIPVTTETQERELAGFRRTAAERN